MGEKILGKFFEEEMEKIYVDIDTAVFKIEKVIRTYTDRKSKKKMALVRWVCIKCCFFYSPNHNKKRNWTLNI